MGVNGLVRKVLAEIGINPERFSLQWASAAEAPRFVKLITGFTQKMKELGPLGASEGISSEEVQIRIAKGIELLSSSKLRVGFGNVTKALRKEVPNLNDAMIAQAIDDKLSKSISGLLG